jgi:hypothetical protein
LVAFEFVHAALQRIDPPHQVFDGRLLRQGGTGRHGRAQNPTEKTKASHVILRDRPDSAGLMPHMPLRCRWCNPNSAAPFLDCDS